MKNIAVNYLTKFNSDHNLSPKVRGVGAYNASLEAAKAQGYVDDLHDHISSTVLQRSLPLETGECTKLINPQDPYKSFHAGTRIRKNLDESSTISVKELKDATVESWLGFHLVSKDGVICKDGSSDYWPLTKTSLADIHKPLFSSQPPTYRRKTAFVAIGNDEFNNLCHFVFDFLSKLSLAADLIASMSIVIERPTHEFQDYFLKSACHDKDWELIYLEPGQSLMAETLFYVSPGSAHPIYRCSSWAIDYVKSLARFDVCTEINASCELLYITRRRRKLLNEEELLTSLKNANISFNSVDLEKMNTPEKIYAYTSHRSILSVYGANNTFVLFKTFLPERLIEIFPNMGQNMSCYTQVARKVGVDNFAITATAQIINESLPGHPDLFLDSPSIELIASTLTDLRQPLRTAAQ